MAVAFTSHGYDSTTTNPYTEAAWADAHPSIGSASYGVRGPADWKVTAVSGQDRTVAIAAGKGFGHGVTDKTIANDTIQLDTIASGSRWDLIACRRDWTPTAGVSQFAKVNGGTTQVIPGGRLSNPGGIDDQPLALVQVTAGQTQPTAIIDLRVWSGAGGGIVAAHDLARSYLDAVGTRLSINGVEWTRRVGANDVPEWASADLTHSSADVTTFGPGWSALTGAHKPRVHRSGQMAHLVGGVNIGSSGNITNILTIPPAYQPADTGSRFIGANVSSGGAVYELVMANGVVSIPPSTYRSGTISANHILPVVASWPLY